jgi:RNA polymerase sigma-70 factor (ECF subfamily)
VFREYGPALGRLAALYEPDPTDRADLLQEITLALWKALRSFRGECSERTFVYRVAHNRALTHRRQARRDRWVSIEAAAELPDPRPDPAGWAAIREGSQRLLGAVRSLAPVRRQVVTLRLEGLPNREIAQVLGLSENAVAIHLNRAKKQLAQLLPVEELR